MSDRPHDISDLYLSPVALELDRRLDELSSKSVDEIDLQVAISTDRQPGADESRAQLLLQSLTHVLPLHGWDVGWEPRGLRVGHGDHHLVLGLPDSVRAYLAADSAS